MTTDDAARDRPDWDEIHGFTSPGEYARFARWLGEAVSEGAFVEIDVAERYSGSSIFDERWFRTPAGQVWRVVAPDFPFTGVSGESTWAPTDDRGVNGLQGGDPARLAQALVQIASRAEPLLRVWPAPTRSALASRRPKTSLRRPTPTANYPAISPTPTTKTA